MNRYRTTIPMLLVLFVCATSATAQSKVLTNGAPESGGLSAIRLAHLDSGMTGWVKNKWTNGAVALIARKGKITFYKAYGYNDSETKTPLDKNGIFRIASQTKAVTTVAVMILWEEGKFSLDDPVSKFIPSFGHQQVLEKFEPKDTTYTTVPANRLITIRDLLTHTSGLGYPGIGTAEEKAIYAKYKITGGVGVKGEKISDAMNRLGTLPLFFQPGEKWKYGLGHDVLGYLVEVWSGMSLEDFFAQRIFQPLGMKDTYFNVPQEKANRLVNFFQQDGTGAIKKQESVFGGALNLNYPLEKKDYFSGGGGLKSTAPDYLILLQAMLNGGGLPGKRILRPQTVEQMSINQIGDIDAGILKTTNPPLSSDVDFFPGLRKRWAFGHMITLDPVRDGRRAGSLTWAGLLNTYYWIDPASRMAGVVMMQMLPFADAHALKLYREFERGIYRAFKSA